MPKATIQGLVDPDFSPLADQLWGPGVKDIDELAQFEYKVFNDLLMLGLSIQQVPFQWGPPGAGKTESIRAIHSIKDQNGNPYQVIDLKPSTQDPTIIHGMFYTSLDDGKTTMKRSVPEIVDQIMEYWEQSNGLTILFLDELTTCMPSQQAAMLGVLTHGEFGSISIADISAQVCAANPPGTVMSVIPISEAILNRCFHIPIYGNPKVFLEEYGAGFGNPANAPDPSTLWYVDGLLGEADRNLPAFRNGRWSPSTLVPYDQMEHTPRSVTNWAQMVRAINHRFAGARDDVRHHYLIVATTAYLGPKWATKFENVLSREETDISWSDIFADRIQARGLGWSSPTDEFSLSANDLSHNKIGSPMPHEQVYYLMDSIASLISQETTAGLTTDTALGAATVAWGIIETTASPSLRAQLYRYAPALIRWGNLRYADTDGTTSKVPAFLSSESRDGAKSALRKA